MKKLIIFTLLIHISLYSQKNDSLQIKKINNYFIKNQFSSHNNLNFKSYNNTSPIFIYNKNTNLIDNYEFVRDTIVHKKSMYLTGDISLKKDSLNPYGTNSISSSLILGAITTIIDTVFK